MTPPTPSSTRTHTLCPYTTLFRAPHLLRGYRLADIVELVRFVEAEAPVEQRMRVDRTLVLAGVAHHHRDKALVSALGRRHQAVAGSRGMARSEEHPSELQSLMRISYASFGSTQH